METWSLSAGTIDFVIWVDETLWVESGLFENCNSLFGRQGAVFGSKSCGYTDWVALPDSSMLVDWGWICIIELGCKVFGVQLRFLAKFDKLLDFIEMLLHSVFELLLCVSCAHFCFVVAFAQTQLHILTGCTQQQPSREGLVVHVSCSAMQWQGGFPCLEKEALVFVLLSVNFVKR